MAKKNSAKKTSKKSSKKKSSKTKTVKDKTKSKKAAKKVNKRTPKVVQKRESLYGKLFLRLVLIVIGIFGVYWAWNSDWVQGVSIVVLAIAIWIIMELIREFKKWN